jgi:protein gp37
LSKRAETDGYHVNRVDPWHRRDPGVTWNPTTGCDQISPGCDHCYALAMAKRLKGMGSAKYQRDGDPRTSGPGFGLTMHPDVMDAPLRWRKPRRVFVNSMSDLFHQDVTDEFVAEVFVVMAMARQHTFQILTKRHARMRALLSSPRWIVLCDEAQSRVINRIPSGSLREQKDRQWWREVTGPLPNVWLGVSVENQKWADIRIPALLDTPAVVRFVSAEPLLGPVRIRFSRCREHDFPVGMCTFSCPGRTRLHWVITGGEVRARCATVRSRLGEVDPRSVQRVGGRVLPQAARRDPAEVRWA